MDGDGTFHEGILFPTKPDLDSASESLLKHVRCRCKTYTKNTCGTLICTCKINGLKCVASCGDCRGRDCKNSNIDISTSLLDNDLDDLDVFI